MSSWRGWKEIKSGRWIRKGEQERVAIRAALGLALNPVQSLHQDPIPEIFKIYENRKGKRCGKMQGEGVAGSSVEKGEEKIGKCSEHSVHVSLSAVLSPQPTNLERKSVSNITTDTGELSNKRSPPPKRTGWHW